MQPTVNTLMKGCRKIAAAAFQSYRFPSGRRERIARIDGAQRNRLSGRLAACAAALKKPVENIEREDGHRQVFTAEIRQRIESERQITDTSPLDGEGKCAIRTLDDHLPRGLRSQWPGIGRAE